MNRWFERLLGLMLLGLVGAESGALPNLPAGRWFTNYEQARAQARRLDKPLLVVFR